MCHFFVNNCICSHYILYSHAWPNCISYGLLVDNNCISHNCRWKDKAPLSNSPLETTWLNHEIGRCHLELGEFEAAREYGEKSMKCAQEANDQVWQLNASVLVAQSYGKYFW